MSDVQISRKNDPIKVKEMRLGLFHVRWMLKDSKKTASYKQKLQLLGSQSSCIFTLSLNIVQKLENVPLPNDKNKFIITVEEMLPRNSTDVMMSEKVKSSMHQEQLPKFSQQIAGSKVKQMNPWASSPVYMWIHPHIQPHTSSFYTNEIPLQNIAERVWRRQIEGSLPDAITLWIDFGTTTSGEKTIIQGLKRLLYSQNQCDVQFLCQNGQVVGAHTLILSAASQFFATMFESKLLVSGIITVKIDDFDMEVIKQLLVYLYTGIVPNLSDEGTALSFFKLSDKYGIETLKNECVEVLQKSVTLDNAISLLILSHLRGVPKLFDSALEFIAANGYEICSQQKWMDLMKNYPELCIMTTRRMTAKQDI